MSQESPVKPVGLARECQVIESNCSISIFTKSIHELLVDSNLIKVLLKYFYCFCCSLHPTIAQTILAFSEFK